MADKVKIHGPSADELARLKAVLAQIGGPQVQWGAVDAYNLWVTETRLDHDRQAAWRVLVATWVLAAATIALVVATVGLIVVSVNAQP